LRGIARTGDGDIDAQAEFAPSIRAIARRNVNSRNRAAQLIVARSQTRSS
jgi:hypothetical protein